MHKPLLITGGAGFIGANFIHYHLTQYPDHPLINLDKLSYAADLNNLADVETHPQYQFVQGDIQDRDLLNHVFTKHNIGGVIHFAAESHVDNSISSPEPFFQSNVMGTFTLIDVARQFWMTGPNAFKAGHEHCRFHHISTDEVYGSLGDSGYFYEDTPYAPNSPYSASKAGSDFIVRSYHQTYGMNVVTTNCSNNFGPMQHDEKLIPTIIRKALAHEIIPIYGDGKFVRDWLFVLDHVTGIDAVFRQGQSGETYNIGGNNEKQNLELARSITQQLDQIKPLSGQSYGDFIRLVPDRPGHDRRYAINCDKIKTELGWVPTTDFQQAIATTIKWYMKKYEKI